MRGDAGTNKTVNVGSTLDNTSTLNGIQGNLGVVVRTAFNWPVANLNINDQGAPAGQNYVIGTVGAATETVTRNGIATISGGPGVSGVIHRGRVPVQNDADGDVFDFEDIDADTEDVTAPADQINLIGDPVDIPVSTDDGDSDSFDFSYAGLPTGLSFSSTTGENLRYDLKLCVPYDA